jgi:hypothetical protein
LVATRRPDDRVPETWEGHLDVTGTVVSGTLVNSDHRATTA